MLHFLYINGLFHYFLHKILKRTRKKIFKLKNIHLSKYIQKHLKSMPQSSKR